MKLLQKEKEAIVKEAKKRFERGINWEGSWRRRFIEDVKFANADSENLYQWENKIQKERHLDNRPCLTINKTHQHNLLIINDAKENKPGVTVRPIGNGATYEAAQVWAGVIRKIEYMSNAQIAYDIATEFQVQGGKGYWRVVTNYADDESFDQDIFIKSIADPLTVLLDYHAKERDKSDSRWGFIFEEEDDDVLKSKYPKHKDLIGTQPLDAVGGWVKEGSTRVAEYYRVVEKEDQLHHLTLQDGSQTTARRSLIPKELHAEIDANPLTKTRIIRVKKVEWYLIIGSTVVEEKEWPGSTIPIVPLLGEETVIDGQYDCRGHTRFMKDPQRMYNYWSPLSLNTQLPTPKGWIYMRDVEAGDWLFDEKGQPVQVVGVSPVHLHRDCYQVNFDDGSHIIADGEHLWTVEERGKRKTATYDWQKKTITTKELTPKKHFILCAEALDLCAKNLLVHPYALGAWLGDGTSAEPQITSGLSDIDEMREILLACQVNVGYPRIYGEKTAGVLSLHNERAKFKTLGLLGNKHFPDAYLRASREQRFALLQGLMDTDGSYGLTSHQCEFTTTNSDIATGFGELLSSLGIKAKYVKKAARRALMPDGLHSACQEAWQFYFTTTESVFRLSRKKNAHEKKRNIHTRRFKRHEIVSVIPVASVPVKCVSINSESHLFLAGPGMIPTHNSAAVEFGALQTKTPWIAPVEAIEGYEDDWKDANTQNKSILPYNAMSDSGEPIPPPQRIQPPVASPVALQGMQIAQQEIMMVSGQYQSSMGEQGNERSGKAINERQRQGEKATYHFIDNLGIAIRRTGKILLELIPKIYDTKRVLMALGEDGMSFEVELDPQAQELFKQEQDHNSEVVKRVLNPALGQWDVQADIGPAYATKREEAFNAFTLILTQAPQLAALIGDLLLQAGDFPMADEAAARLKRMVPPAALGKGPTQTEQELQGQIQQLQELLQKTLEQNANDRVKIKGHAEKRDIELFNAVSKRLQVLQQGAPFGPEEVKALVADAMHEAQQTTLDPAQKAVGDELGVPQQMPLPLDHPPVPGARKAPDGEWYAEDPLRHGKYLKVRHGVTPQSLKQGFLGANGQR